MEKIKGKITNNIEYKAKKYQKQLTGKISVEKCKKCEIGRDKLLL